MNYENTKIVDCKFDFTELQIISYALKFMYNSHGGIDFIRPFYIGDDMTDDEIKTDLIKLRGIISGFERMSEEK